MVSNTITSSGPSPIYATETAGLGITDNVLLLPSGRTAIDIDVGVTLLVEQGNTIVYKA